MTVGKSCILTSNVTIRPEAIDFKQVCNLKDVEDLVRRPDKDQLTSVDYIR